MGLQHSTRRLRSRGSTGKGRFDVVHASLVMMSLLVLKFDDGDDYDDDDDDDDHDHDHDD